MVRNVLTSGTSSGDSPDGRNLLGRVLDRIVEARAMRDQAMGLKEFAEITLLLEELYIEAANARLQAPSGRTDFATETDK